MKFVPVKEHPPIPSKDYIHYLTEHQVSTTAPRQQVFDQPPLPGLYIISGFFQTAISEYNCPQGIDTEGFKNNLIIACFPKADIWDRIYRQHWKKGNTPNGC